MFLKIIGCALRSTDYQFVEFLFLLWKRINGFYNISNNNNKKAFSGEGYRNQLAANGEAANWYLIGLGFYFNGTIPVAQL